MRFSVKLILICESVFVVLTVLMSVIIGSMAYDKTRQSAIDSYLYEADSIINNINMYLAGVGAEQKPIKDYAPSIVDIFSKNDVQMEVYDKNLNRLYSNRTLSENNRPELAAAMKNKGQKIFVLRKMDDSYLAFFSQFVEYGDGGLLICLVKDMSSLHGQRQSIWMLVVRVLLVGIVLVALVMWLVTSYLMRPVVRLSRAAERIAKGNYNERVWVKNQDEFGELAQSFNIMASAVEDNIAELEEKNDAQQRMMDNLTHELRTPLTSIIGYAELLKKIPYDAAVFEKGLGYIYSEGQRMLTLNKTLLDLSWYQKKTGHFESVDVSDIMYQVKELVDLRARDKGVTISVEAASIMLDSMPELLRSLLTNLVDNALKACKEGDSITLMAGEAEEDVILRVTDTGRGMSAEELSHIMEPFYQVAYARSRSDEGAYAGLGLGLSIVDQIVSKHQGQIHFESTPDAGTTVIVRLPRHHEP